MHSTAESITPPVQAADLVHRIGEGDSHAEELLVRQYQRGLKEMLCHRTGDPELAHDLLQDTLTIVINRLRETGLEEPDKLVAFMHRTAHNLVIAHFRKETRRGTQANTELVEIQSDPRESQLQAMLSREEGQLVHQLLHELKTPRDREILLRFYVWEQEKRVVCQALHLDATQFDRVISRARQRFKSLVEKQWALRD